MAQQLTQGPDGAMYDLTDPDDAQKYAQLVAAQKGGGFGKLIAGGTALMAAYEAMRIQDLSSIVGRYQQKIHAADRKRKAMELGIEVSKLDDGDIAFKAGGGAATQPKIGETGFDWPTYSELGHELVKFQARKEYAMGEIFCGLSQVLWITAGLSGAMALAPNGQGSIPVPQPAEMLPALAVALGFAEAVSQTNEVSDYERNGGYYGSYRRNRPRGFLGLGG